MLRIGFTLVPTGLTSISRYDMAKIPVSRRTRSASSPVVHEQGDIESRLDHPGYYIRRLHQISVAIFLSMSQKFDITQIQYAALLTISHSPGIDQVTLGKFVALDRQSTSSVVGRLKEKGLILKRMRDGRTSELHITPKGNKLISQITPLEASVDETLLLPISADERETFMRLVKKLVDDNNDLSRAPSDFGIKGV